jgi:hypothetical protein
MESRETSLCRLQLLAATLCAGLIAAACGSDTNECIALPDTCNPVLSTDFNTIYQSVLAPRCGTGAGVTTCHGSAAPQAGLSMSDVNTAYNSLLGVGSTQARVVRGDPGCSPLMARLTSADASARMPRGDAPLGAGVICAIQSWINEGAAR